jgi:hypothetical protein
MLTSNQEAIFSPKATALRLALKRIFKSHTPSCRYSRLICDSNRSGIEIWKSLMTDNSKRDLIYNCTEMTGFDSTSRQMWQATMKEFKPRIGNIWMISTNRFILAAAKTMSILAGFSMKTARSLHEIKG